MKHSRAWLCACLVAFVGRAQGSDPWVATFQLGASSWPALRNVAIPPGGYEVLELGGFNPTGGNIEMGLYRPRRSVADQELQLGCEFGVWWHEGGKQTTFLEPARRLTLRGQAAANGGHVTGSARWFWPRAGIAPFVGIGAGWYLLVFKETFGDMVVDTSARTNAPGGFLTAGLEVRGASGFAFRTDAQAHLVSFGGASLRGQRVSGPVYTLRIGASLRF